MPIQSLIVPLAGLQCGVFCFEFTLKLVSCRSPPHIICLLFCLFELSCSMSLEIKRQVDWSDSSSTEKRAIIVFVVSFYSLEFMLK